MIDKVDFADEAEHFENKLSPASKARHRVNKVNRVAEVQRGGGELDCVDPASRFRGEVVSVGKTGYFVHQGGRSYFCNINNSFKSEEKPIVGDIVQFEKREDKFFVLDIMPRRSVVRRSFSLVPDAEPQAIVANVDVVFIVTSANREFSHNRIERFKKMCDGTKCVVVLTKIDCGKYIPQINDAVKINALDKDSAKQLFEHWGAGQTAMLVGSSGVGKSTIVNTLTGLNLKTCEVMGERRNNQGRHTTSARTMYYLSDGRKIVDCPGVKFV